MLIHLEVIQSILSYSDRTLTAEQSFGIHSGILSEGVFRDGSERRTKAGSMGNFPSGRKCSYGAAFCKPQSITDHIHRGILMAGPGSLLDIFSV